MRVDLQLDDGLDRLVRRIEGRAARAIERPFARHARRLQQEARAQWPVDTGRSRRQLRIDVYLTTAGVVVEATCDVTYATDVRRRGQPKGEAWRELVERPMTAIGRTVGDDVARELAAVVEDR